MDYWKVQDLEASGVAGGGGGEYEIDSIMRAYSPKSTADTSSIANSSHVGAFVEHVQGEALRYTSRDMEIIRQQARIQAQGNNGEMNELRVIVDNYENVIAYMEQSYREKLAQRDMELAETASDRDALQGDMKGMDKGYHDLQTRFYRLRTMIEDMRSNEQRLKGVCRKYEERLVAEQERYRLLLLTTKDQLKLSSNELDTIEARKDNEVARKDAELRLERTRNATLKATLDQKMAENAELVAICDQLMN